MKEITKIIYLNVYRGLLHDDKLIFAMMLAVRIAINNKLLTLQEWEFFTKGISIVTLGNVKNSETAGLSDKHWRYLVALESINHNFQGISKQANLWSQWQKSKELGILPGEWESKLTSFQKLMIVKGIREEHLIEQMKKYLKDELGKEYIQITQADLESAYLDSDNKTPIIIILQKGADPTTSF